MANFNRVILAGNLTRDPELSYTPSNAAICKFGLAVNRKWFSKAENTTREETMFIDCVAWAKSGELINQYCRKGKPILVEGRLNYETWTSSEGQKRSRHSVTVDNFQFLGGPGQQGQQGDRPPPAADTRANSFDDGPPPVPSTPQPPSPDDVPF